ncbi:MAG: alpha/beta hydrolase [Desemzia incerta]
MQRNKRKNILVILGVLILVIGIAIIGYLSDAYEPHQSAIEALQSTQNVIVTEDEEYIRFEPKENKYQAGLVFYQGGKVEEEAYALLMRSLAEKGISVYLVRMPFNLAVFDSDAAEKVISDQEEINNWYVSGHSLGGVMAASFAEKNPEQLEGIIFLASYPAGDFSAADLDTLSIYGTYDEVLNTEAYFEAFESLPKVKEEVIEGGNHAQFGNYGPQDGDGTAAISVEEQQKNTVNGIIEFIEASAEN